MDTAGLPARLQARLARGRAAAVARMGAANGGSDAVVKRLTGRKVPDPFSGEKVPERVVVHEGPMRLGSNRGAGQFRTVSTPGGDVTVAVRVANWPHDAPTFRDGDLIEIAAGVNAGTVWRVVEGDRADQATAYRVPVVAHH